MKALICIVMAVFMSNLPHVAFAESAGPQANQMIPTSVVVDQLSRAESVANITELLSREEAQEQLQKFGLSREEVSNRLASLSDSEIRDLTKQIDQAKFGGDAIVGVLVIVVLVLLIIFLAKRV